MTIAVRRLKVVKSGGRVSVYCNQAGEADAQVGTTQTVTGFHHTRHGMFSVSAANTVDNLEIQ